MSDNPAQASPADSAPVSHAFAPNAQVTEADVIAAHRMLLGREPRLEDYYGYLAAGHTSPLTTGELILQIVRSPEFRARHGVDDSAEDKRRLHSLLDYVGLFGDDRPLAEAPARIPLRSSVCQQSHFALDQYRAWMRALREPPQLHRKQWEYFFIAQSLHERGMLKPGSRGVTFGVGREPLPALCASLGAAVLATDQSIDKAISAGWVRTGEHSIDLAALNDRGICAPEAFDRLVSFRTVDMNDIPADLEGQFDYCWSTCALEHLGSLRHGMEFVKNAMRVLKPGGVAVHTTEFNLSSDAETINERDLAIYRRQDIDRLIDELTANGEHVEPIDWTPGRGMAESVADLPPFGAGTPHVRLRIFEFDCTSIGIIATRRPAPADQRRLAWALAAARAVRDVWNRARAVLLPSRKRET